MFDLPPEIQQQLDEISEEIVTTSQAVLNDVDHKTIAAEMNERNWDERRAREKSSRRRETSIGSSRSNNSIEGSRPAKEARTQDSSSSTNKENNNNNGTTTVAATESSSSSSSSLQSQNESSSGEGSSSNVGDRDGKRVYSCIYYCIATFVYRVASI